MNNSERRFTNRAKVKRIKYERQRWNVLANILF